MSLHWVTSRPELVPIKLKAREMEKKSPVISPESFLLDIKLNE